MAISVKIPTALRKYANDTNTIELDGSAVGPVLEQLGSKFHELKKHLFNDDGTLRNFVNVSLNDSNIRDLQGSDTSLKDGDELSIVPAIAGGASSWCEFHLNTVCSSRQDAARAEARGSSAPK